jgi:hypothetical protein
MARVVYRSGSQARYAEQVIPIGVAPELPKPQAQALVSLRSSNPARTQAHFDASIPAELIGSRFALQVLDASGRLVRVVDSGVFGALSHSMTWGLNDTDGRPVPAGVYFARLVVGGAESKVRLAVLR